MLTLGANRRSRFLTGYKPKATAGGKEIDRPRRRSDVQNRNNPEASVTCGAKRHRLEPGVIGLKGHYIVSALIRLSSHNKLFNERTACVRSE